MDVAVVGAGRVGTAFAALLERAGHRIVAVSGREDTRARAARFLPHAPFVPPSDAARAGQAVLLALPDDAVAPVCADLAAGGAFRDDQSVIHPSGSTPLLALGPARGAGAEVLVLHPLQTFPDVEAGIDRLPGSHVAVTAWEEEAFTVGERLAGDVGARPFRLSEEDRPLYHAAAVFCSNYVAVVEGVAERLFRLAGLEDPVPMFAPLAEAAMANTLRLGPAAALTGPVARGDAGTVRRNLEALSRHAADTLPAYVALARAALDLAAPHLDERARRDVEEVLAEWS
ncbi:MAG: Rossmann-like and DUF2520 domain-containing protein [Actinomycetota bacterium]